jgi:molecular chaperone GrpE
MPRKKKHDETTPIEGQEKDMTDSNSVETTTNTALEALQEELAQTNAKANEYLEGWQRSMADFSNYKKRIEREQAQNQQLATANVIKRYLELFDDLERALKNRPKEAEAANWAEGVELIYRKFLAYLENEGVQLIEVDGQFFDPNLHEAISHEDHPELESGQIIGVVQQGYRLGDRVLRPARVRVAR